MRGRRRLVFIVTRISSQAFFHNLICSRVSREKDRWVEVAVVGTVDLFITNVEPHVDEFSLCVLPV